MQNVHATELQSFYLQLAQTPLTTILMFSSLKSAGNIMVGIAISFKQYVCLHFVQRK